MIVYFRISKISPLRLDWGAIVSAMGTRILPIKFDGSSALNSMELESKNQPYIISIRGYIVHLKIEL